MDQTQYPEGCLCRELELCYVTIAMVTDYDAGVGGGEPVSAERVVEVFRENNVKLHDLLLASGDAVMRVFHRGDPEDPAAAGGSPLRDRVARRANLT